MFYHSNNIKNEINSIRKTGIKGCRLIHSISVLVPLDYYSLNYAYLKKKIKKIFKYIPMYNMI